MSAKKVRSVLSELEKFPESKARMAEREETIKRNLNIYLNGLDERINKTMSNYHETTSMLVDVMIEMCSELYGSKSDTVLKNMEPKIDKATQLLNNTDKIWEEYVPDDNE
jgi:hypothetical protein